jgi:hypothetical protein
MALARLQPDGSFSGVMPRQKFSNGICMFGGTATLASATSGYVKVQ